MDHNKQKEILKWILRRVDRAKRHRRELEERLERIRAERESPIGSPGYEPLPRVMEPGNGAASIVLKIADIEDRLYEQKDELEKAYVQVMDIIDFIPQPEPARRIFELYHLDGLRFNKVAEAIPMSRSRAYEIYDEVLDGLLGIQKVQDMVKDFEDNYINWFVKQEKVRTNKVTLNK